MRSTSREERSISRGVSAGSSGGVSGVHYGMIEQDRGRSATMGRNLYFTLCTDGMDIVP
jgi:hypothetical protein